MDGIEDQITRHIFTRTLHCSASELCKTRMWRCIDSVQMNDQGSNAGFSTSIDRKLLKYRCESCWPQAQNYHRELHHDDWSQGRVTAPLFSDFSFLTFNCPSGLPSFKRWRPRGARNETAAASEKRPIDLPRRDD